MNDKLKVIFKSEDLIEIGVKLSKLQNVETEQAALDIYYFLDDDENRENIILKFIESLAPPVYVHSLLFNLEYLLENHVDFLGIIISRCLNTRNYGDLFVDNFLENIGDTKDLLKILDTLDIDRVKLEPYL